MMEEQIKCPTQPQLCLSDSIRPLISPPVGRDEGGGVLV